MTLLEKLHNLGNPRRNFILLCRSIEARSTTILTGFLIIFVITTITEMILLVGDGKHASVAHLNLSPRSDTFSATSPHSKTTFQPPRLKPTSGSWQKVYGTREKFFVFSAYYEARKVEKKLRIIAVAKLNNTDDVWCRMWSVSGSHVATERAQLQAIREHWNLTYSAFYVFCPLNGIKTVPHSVSLVNNPYRFKPCTNRLFVHNLKKGNNKKPNDITMAICVKPLHYYYDKTMALLQFLEYYQLLGVSHVLLYNSTSSAATSCLLKDYERRGVVSVLPWQRLDVGSQTETRTGGGSQTEIRTGGMLAALNDCLHRTTHRFTHVAMLDFDELIVPRHHYTLQDLLRSIDPSPEKSKIGSYVIQNAFFYLQWPDEVKGDTFEKSLLALSKTRRLIELHPHHNRSKFICKPEFTLEVGDHFVYEHVGEYGELNVSEKEAIMHHYRICEFGGDDCVKQASATDTTVYRYRTPLIDNVKQRWNELKRKCPLPELFKLGDLFERSPEMLA